MEKRKILFLGETYRADAITWTSGLKEFGNFEIISWELKQRGAGTTNRLLRILEYSFAIFRIKSIVRAQKPDMVIAERTTSYGFLAALTGKKPVAIAQQGITDLWPETSMLYPIKKRLQDYAFKKADLIHAWGKVMTTSMKNANVDMQKVMVLPKGINLNHYTDNNTADPEKINAIVTRSLEPEYRHDIILKAFAVLHDKGYDFKLTIVGDGSQLANLKALANRLGINEKVIFTGRIQNNALPVLLLQANYYISMPVTEGVSASLFEAMATRSYPLVTDIAGNQDWIRHRENGQLITVDDHEMLASELIWAAENPDYRKQATSDNRKLTEEKANYSVNMKIIAEQYHALINTAKKN
jgi:glycosyltransferase involved in cell wall biosynthesis